MVKYTTQHTFSTQIKHNHKLSMGGMQSQYRKKANDTELLELDTSENNSTLRRCSTLTDLYYPISAAKV